MGEIGNRGHRAEQPPWRGADQAEDVRPVAVDSTHGVDQGRAGHAIEHVVASHGRFHIVEKFEEAMRRTVIRLDSRTRPRASES